MGSGLTRSPCKPCLAVSRVEREIILDYGALAARKSDFQYVRTLTECCQLGLRPCINQTNKSEVNLSDSLAILAHEMHLLLRRQYSFLYFLVFNTPGFLFANSLLPAKGASCLDLFSERVVAINEQPTCNFNQLFSSGICMFSRAVSLLLLMQSAKWRET